MMASTTAGEDVQLKHLPLRVARKEGGVRASPVICRCGYAFPAPSDKGRAPIRVLPSGTGMARASRFDTLSKCDG